MHTPNLTTDRTPTERIAREVIEGLQVELDHLIDVHNDNNRAAWEMAAQKADEVRRVCLMVADAIQNRPVMPKPPVLHPVFADIVAGLGGKRLA